MLASHCGLDIKSKIVVCCVAVEVLTVIIIKLLKKNPIHEHRLKLLFSVDLVIFLSEMHSDFLAEF